MINIIERGEPPSEKTYTTSCYNCKTKFSFQGKDAKTSFDQREGDYLMINCPVCHNPCYHYKTTYWDRR